MFFSRGEERRVIGNTMIGFDIWKRECMLIKEPKSRNLILRNRCFDLERLLEIEQTIKMLVEYYLNDCSFEF